MEQQMAISIKEAAQMLGVYTATLYSIADEGKLPGARRLGKRIVIHRTTFEKWWKEGTGE